MAIKVEIEFTIDNQPLIKEYTSDSISELVAGNQISSDNSTPSFSVIGQYGNIKIQDKDRLIEKKYNEGLLENTALIKIYINDNLFRQYYGDNITYEAKDHKFNITFKEESYYKLKDIMIPKNFYQTNVSAWTLFYRLFNYSGLASYVIDSNTYSRLNSIIIKNYYFEGGSLLETLNKFCNLTMTCVVIKYNEMEVIDYV